MIFMGRLGVCGRSNRLINLFERANLLRFRGCDCGVSVARISEISGVF